MLGVEDDVRTPGVQLLDGRSIQVGDFRVQRCDFVFQLGSRVGLEQLMVSAPARWAVGALAERPDDESRRERAVAALNATGQPAGDSTRFDLLVVRIDGGTILGGLLVLFGTGPAAYVLTPDTSLADLLADDRGRLAGIFADGVGPDVPGLLDEGGRGDWEERVREVVDEFEPWLAMPRGAHAAAPGHAIVRAVRGVGTPGETVARRVRRPGVGVRAGQALRRLGTAARERQAGRGGRTGEIGLP
ncbi:hypothetical protein [Kineosporia succinea]|uniref:ESAT-6 protein secretion system EspG family protein n=1 Tax=Kineosporia succinea TaxID=84632 RepID=A0ABT9NV98_9ACTN|nr:hypothetical protein [Kineosporia succinea]MDP9824353.1 hypothetical protein [Kineosporia succinea]